MSDGHGKPKRAQDDPNLVFTQQKLLIEIDRDEVKKHALAEPPKEQGKRDQKKATIQGTPQLICRLKFFMKVSDAQAAIPRERCAVLGGNAALSVFL
jgi:hypothetical protein